MGKFIKVKKIVTRNDQTLEIENDNLLIDDIKSFRNWHKKGDIENAIPGDFCQVSIKSLTGKEGFYTIKINESEKSFGDRLGLVIGL